MVNLDAFKSFGGFPTDRLGGEDHTMVTKAAVRGYKVIVYPEALLWHRLFTPGSLTKTVVANEEEDHALGKYVGSKQMTMRPYLDALPEAMHGILEQALLPRDPSTGKYIYDDNYTPMHAV